MWDVARSISTLKKECCSVVLIYSYSGTVRNSSTTCCLLEGLWKAADIRCMVFTQYHTKCLKEQKVRRCLHQLQLNYRTALWCLVRLLMTNAKRDRTLDKIWVYNLYTEKWMKYIAEGWVALHMVTDYPYGCCTVSVDRAIYVFPVPRDNVAELSTTLCLWKLQRDRCGRLVWPLLAKQPLLGSSCKKSRQQNCNKISKTLLSTSINNFGPTVTLEITSSKHHAKVLKI